MQISLSSADGFLGQDAFLQLFVEQLKHQDPTEPMDGSAMMAQLAQFSTLEKLAHLESSFSQLLQMAELEQARDLVGKTAVTWPDASGVFAVGVVEAARAEGDQVGVVIGGQFYALDQIAEVRATEMAGV